MYRSGKFSAKQKLTRSRAGSPVVTPSRRHRVLLIKARQSAPYSSQVDQPRRVCARASSIGQARGSLVLEDVYQREEPLGTLADSTDAIETDVGFKPSGCTIPGA